MGQESSRGPKRVAQGVQKVPKGFQKVAKRHEKDIQKASTRHPNAISKCIGNSIGNSISNAIANAIATATGYRSPLRSMKTNTRTGWLGGTDNSLRSDFFLELNLLLYVKSGMTVCMREYDGNDFLGKETSHLSSSDACPLQTRQLWRHQTLDWNKCQNSNLNIAVSCNMLWFLPWNQPASVYQILNENVHSFVYSATPANTR